MSYNKILEKVNSNESAVGLNLAINSPHLVEFFGSLGFDWVFIDCEHGSMTDSEAEIWPFQWVFLAKIMSKSI